MGEHARRLGAIPFVLLGLGLLFLGVLALNHVVNNFWPFDVERLDLIRATARAQVDASSLLEATNLEILLAFLAAIMVAVTGLVLPLVYYLNKRLRPPEWAPSYLLVLRQAMWVGLWVAFCVWLQMNRTLGPAVILLVAAVLIIFEVLLQVRTRASSVFE
ncbi:MAG: hypothetical protein R3280_16865 [Marinobacter sp.]|uniref:hypothetical protein n=1 Tax=Marinobacter sp. TaxID=50741 RepID=UPI00299EB8FC|nr:hypothetical protein [Marinobacter sp.]MDX1636313.1 hypothetical protein [Marinobacter sp.]